LHSQAVVPSTNLQQAAGKQGEELACAELCRRGYAISARRYRSRFGEIDIVAERDGTVVFVEVKTRRSARRGLAAECIPGWKRRRIGAMALDYLAWSNRPHARCRFDVVAIDGFGTEAEQLRVIEGAFDWR
jgi:putative endonuclease